MTTIAASPRTCAPHVTLERKGSTVSTRQTPHVATTKPFVSPTSSPTTTTTTTTTPRRLPSLGSSSSKRFSGVGSKVGSLEAIGYKPKPSEKKIQSFIKPDFSHVKSKVDAKVVLPTQTNAAISDPTGVVDLRPKVVTTATTAEVATVEGRRATAVTATGPVGAVTTRRPAVVTTLSSSSTLSTASQDSNGVSLAGPNGTRPGRISIRTAGPQSTSRTSVVNSIRSVNAVSVPSTPMSPPHSRQSSTSSVGVNNPAMSPTSPNPSRRLSKHIIPTQKASYGHVKSKVGSFDNIGYVSNSVGRGRASSRASSADDESQVAISNNGRSRSPSAMSSTSSSTTSPTSPTSRRSSFKIPPSKKVDYSNVRSKVGSLEHVHHTPQGGNLRVFSEKLHFREQAQSKIAKEINIVQFYQNSDQSFDGSATQDQEGEQESEHYNQSSIISSSEDSVEDFEPPKNILAVVEEVIESIAELDIEQEPQANGSQDVHLESGVAL